VRVKGWMPWNLRVRRGSWRRLQGWGEPSDCQAIGGRPDRGRRPTGPGGPPATPSSPAGPAARVRPARRLRGFGIALTRRVPDRANRGDPARPGHFTPGRFRQRPGEPADAKRGTQHLNLEILEIRGDLASTVSQSASSPDHPLPPSLRELCPPFCAPVSDLASATTTDSPHQLAIRAVPGDRDRDQRRHARPGRPGRGWRRCADAVGRLDAHRHRGRRDHSQHHRPPDRLVHARRDHRHRLGHLQRHARRDPDGHDLLRLRRRHHRRRRLGQHHPGTVESWGWPGPAAGSASSLPSARRWRRASLRVFACNAGFSGP